MIEALLSDIGKERLKKHDYSDITSVAEEIFFFFSRSNSNNQSDRLESIFNHMNEHNDTLVYNYSTISPEKAVVYPTDKISSSSFDKDKFLDSIDPLLSIGNLHNVNILLENFEKNTSYIPASFSGKYGNDISYYDKAKMICAISSCMYDYFGLNEDTYDSSISADKIKNSEIFLLYSFDTSGIQKFIYTITSSGAQKGLRARSFYLEFIMETIVLELLARLELSKANLLYAGGGHAYLLLPNCKNTYDIIEKFYDELKKWLILRFKGELFISSGYCPCSPNTLANVPEGSYRQLFGNVSAMISQKKSRRYNAEEFALLNAPSTQHERECVVCHNSDILDNEQKCEMCSKLEALASSMLTSDYLVITDNNASSQNSLPLPFGKYLTTIKKEYLSKINGAEYVFNKNKIADKEHISYYISVGDYASSVLFSELANTSSGIKRLGILRADIDNLGHAFVAGYPESINTLSRTSSFSRQMSRFFKSHINNILKNGKFRLDGSNEIKPRNAMIVYSGGDDVFIVGSWDDIIGTAVDLYSEFKLFSQDALTISAGIGIFPEKYPIAAMARESGKLEEFSKDLEGKNAVTLFDISNRYHWDVFINKVIKEKLYTISSFLKNNKEKGNSLLYQMLELARMINNGQRLNIARFAYLLARLKPEEKKSKDPKIQASYDREKKCYTNFSEKMYSWIQNENDRSQLITAIIIYIYYNRDNKKEDKTNVR